MSGKLRRIQRNGLMALLVALTLSAGASMADAACGTPPTVVFVAAAQDVVPGGSVDYTVTITNNSAGSCDFDLSTSGDSAGFTSSLPDGTPFTVAGSSADTTTVRVAAGSGQAIGTTNTTTLTVDAVTVDATTSVNNPLLHNSFNLGSGKWSADNGWGLATGKYGEFSCDTCHGKNTGNIKRVKNSIPDTIGAALVKPVNFQATTGANSFGNDSSIHATSTRICEVCHTYDATGAEGVTVHAYNMPLTASHENNTDCISCHAHNKGFAASCSACHGDGATGKIWPDGIDNNGGRIAYADDQVGAHDNHILVISQELYGMDLATLISDSASTDKQKTICAFCHPNPGGGGHDANGGSDSLVDMQPAGSFEMFTVGAGNHAADTGSGAYNFVNDSCSNLVCHNQMATPTAGSGDWNTPPANPDCTMCHAANGGTQRHDTHVGSSSFVCTECHVDNGTFATGTAGVDHINGDVELKWDNAGSYENDFGDSSVTYSGTAEYKDASWGTCASVACHSNSITPAWNASGVGCSVCHTTTQTTGAHEFHMHLDGDETYGQTGTFSDSDAYDFGCADCHAGDSHVNGSTTVTTNGYVAGTKSCATADCHSHKDTDGVTTVYVPTPAWDVGTFAGDRCAGCHKNSPESAGHEEHQMGFHSEHVYSGNKDFLPVLNSDPLPAYLVLGPADNGDADPMDDSRDPLRGHGGKLADGTITSTIFTCYVCHNNTVTERYNDQATRCNPCHDGTNTIAPTMGDMVVADKSFHVNGVADVVFAKENIRSKAQVRDDLADVPEIADNWVRIGGYKADDGSSYDEQPDTLYNMASLHGGWDAPTKTCQISCHLWEDGRVDKYPAHWINNSIHGSQPIMCIDCHTRLPK